MRRLIYFFTAALAVISSLALFSCDKEDEPQPEATFQIQVNASYTIRYETLEAIEWNIKCPTANGDRITLIHCESGFYEQLKKEGHDIAYFFSQPVGSNTFFRDEDVNGPDGFNFYGPRSLPELFLKMTSKTGQTAYGWVNFDGELETTDNPDFKLTLNILQ